MTDATLRELERCYRASGSVADEEAWLRARIRAGEVELERVELAAYLRHTASTRALDQPPFAPRPRPAAFGVLRDWFAIKRWTHGLERWGREVQARAWVALSHHADERQLLEDIEDWILCPCEAHDKPGVGFSDDELVSMARAAGESARSLVADELVPWALGYRDPIVERKELRGPNRLFLAP